MLLYVIISGSAILIIDHFSPKCGINISDFIILYNTGILVPMIWYMGYFYYISATNYVITGEDNIGGCAFVLMFSYYVAITFWGYSLYFSEANDCQK